jgi:hypothetical protein
LASTGPGIGIDEQAGGEAQDQIAVGDPALEDRRGLGRFLVHVGVEIVAGELGEMLDVGDRDGAAGGLQRVADVELAHPLAERVDVDLMLGRAGIYCSVIAAIIAGESTGARCAACNA